MLLTGLMLFDAVSPAAADVRRGDERSVFYPKGFKTTISDPAPVPRKPGTDTLQYKPLTRIKDDFVVNSGCGGFGADQHQINIASDDHGNMLCVWIEERTGFREVNGQIFDRDGNRVGPVLRISEQYNQWNSEPHLVFNRVSGEYIVLWAESGYDIRFQRVTATGQLVGRNLTANQFYLINTNNPSAAVDSSGNIVVTWYSDAGCCINAEPYCRAFDKEGAPITDQWRLLDGQANPVSSIGWDDRMAADSAGRSVIVWSTFINHQSRISLQVVNRAGNLLSEPLVVSDPADTGDHIFPTVAGMRDGHFLILWVSTDALQARIYHADSGFVSPQFTIVSLNQSWATYAASSDDRNVFYVVWIAGGAYGKTISIHGDSIGATTLLSPPGVVPDWGYPKLSRALSGRLSMAYSRYDRGQSDVLLQGFDPGFQAAGPARKAVDDGCTAWQTNPVIKYNRAGKSLVLWEDQRNGYHDLYGQVLNESGDPVSGNLVLSDTALVHWPANPVIMPDLDGNFIVSFSAGDYSSRNIQMQKITAAGVKAGVSQTITKEYGNYDLQKSALAVNERNEILLCWWTGNLFWSPVIAQMFTSGLTPVSAPVFLASGAQYPSPGKKILGVSVNARLEVLVTWLDYDYHNGLMSRNINGMIFNEHGKAVSDTMILDTFAGNPDEYTAVCAVDDLRNIAFLGYDNGSISVVRRYAADGRTPRNVVELSAPSTQLLVVRFENRKLLATWTAPKQIRGVVFDDNFSSITPLALQDVGVPPLFLYHRAYSADIVDGRIQLAFEAVRDPAFGFDVFVNTQALPEVDFNPVPPNLELVSAVYPNPASGIVNFQYKIGAPRSVAIAVFNIIGQKVRDIESGSRAAGIYNVTFDTRGLPSGVYFLRFTGMTSMSQKVLVIK
jgi:hypothetical protein